MIRGVVLLAMIGVVVVSPLVVSVAFLGLVAWLAWLPVALAFDLPTLTASQSAECGAILLILWTCRHIRREMWT